jgi:hypothetical protein
MTRVVPASLFDSPSDASIRALAAVSDDRLKYDLRSAVVAVGYWWAEAYETATPIQHKRAASIDTVRQNVALLGGDASLEQLAATRHVCFSGSSTKQNSCAPRLASYAMSSCTGGRWSHMCAGP